MVAASESYSHSCRHNPSYIQCGHSGILYFLSAALEVLLFGSFVRFDLIWSSVTDMIISTPSSSPSSLLTYSLLSLYLYLFLLFSPLVSLLFPSFFPVILTFPLPCSSFLLTLFSFPLLTFSSLLYSSFFSFYLLISSLLFSPLLTISYLLSSSFFSSSYLLLSSLLFSHSCVWEDTWTLCTAQPSGLRSISYQEYLER